MSAASETNQVVCDHCRAWTREYHHVLTTAKTATKLDERVVTKVGTNCMGNVCAMCRLFATIVSKEDADPLLGNSILAPRQEDHFNGSPRNTLGIWAVNILGREARDKALDYAESQHTMALTVHRNWHYRHEKERRNMNIADYRNGPGLVMLVDRHDQKSERRIIVDHEFNSDAARNWIQECLRFHVDCSISEHRPLPQQVINCKSGRVIKTPSGAIYTALSYVWGDSGSSQRSSSLELSDAPRVIKDAVDVTMSLGYQYLWVDKLCVHQNNPVLQAQQIATMDEVYENAVVTIVDAVGEHDQHGLCGVSTVPREAQEQVFIDGNGFARIVLDPVPAVLSSKWATRGWTFQEGILSTRCLIFTRSQVYFVCQTTGKCEALPRSPILTNSGYETNLSNIFQHQNSRSRYERSLDMTKAERLSHKINLYQQRELSFASDVLNAFMGVLARCDLFTYWGVPFLTGKGCGITIDVDWSCVDPLTRQAQEINSAYARGLAWTAQGETSTRRPGMPTWSWVSLGRCRIAFPQDPDASKEANTWTLQTWDPALSIDLPGSKDMSPRSLREFWVEHMTQGRKAIPSSGQVLKIKAMATDILKIRLTYEEKDAWEIGRTGCDFDQRINMVVKHNEDIDPRLLTVDIDCFSEFASYYGLNCSKFATCTIAMPGLILMRLNARCFIAEGKREELPEGFRGEIWPNDSYLILRQEANGAMRRVGSFNLRDKGGSVPKLMGLDLRSFDFE
ncbi:heterokaryon incompatibility protein-domain-containing protein [Xylariaceae sp. FL1272]|nr:heterokaryon incompatibility protein-domain-containing protein [Xylariaceae sp. FL1272]